MNMKTSNSNAVHSSSGILKPGVTEQIFLLKESTTRKGYEANCALLGIGIWEGYALLGYAYSDARRIHRLNWRRT